MPQHEFHEDNEIGKRGERIVSTYFTKYGRKVQDTSDIPEYQHADIDMLVEGKDGNMVPVEIKNDTWISRTNNVFYETISNVDYNTIGCAEKSKADIFIVVSEDSKSMYFFKMAKLREYVHSNKDKLKYIPRVSGSNSAGYCVPLSSLESIGYKKIVYD